jgi:cytochrome c556
MKLPSLALCSLLIALSAAAAAADTRQKVELPPMMRDHMMGNMRDHLLAVTEIQEALAAGAFDRAADIAERRLGMSSLNSHGASHMAPHMPQAMRDIGTGMHRAASRFAVAAQEAAVTGDTRRALGSLAEMSRQCVACHAAYRVH